MRETLGVFRRLIGLSAVQFVPEGISGNVSEMCCRRLSEPAVMLASHPQFRSEGASSEPRRAEVNAQEHPEHFPTQSCWSSDSPSRILDPLSRETNRICFWCPPPEQPDEIPRIGLPARLGQSIRRHVADFPAPPISRRRKPADRSSMRASSAGAPAHFVTAVRTGRRATPAWRHQKGGAAAWHTRFLYHSCNISGFLFCGALLHKSGSGRSSPFPGQSYPTGRVTGMPSVV